LPLYEDKSFEIQDLPAVIEDLTPQSQMVQNKSDDQVGRWSERPQGIFRACKSFSLPRGFMKRHMENSFICEFTFICSGIVILVD